MLRKKYAIVVVKDSAHKEMKEQAKARGLPRGARKQGHHGAPGETLREIEIAFGREENVAVVEAPGTTATCEKCHAIMEVGAELMVYCERCDTHEDRDRVSTRNLLRLYFAGNFKKPTARKTTARFAKRHKNKELV
jgi:transposase